MSEVGEPIRWDKPGTGTWAHDPSHSSGPVTRIVQELFPTAMADGFREFTARYGLVVSHIDVRYVNGHPYGAVRIAGVPPSDGPPPPSWLLRLLTRVHPELRRRNRRARSALAGRIWRQDLERWFDELRPAQVTSMRALQAVSPAELDDVALVAHVEACTEALAHGLRVHFSLLGASSVPIGLHLLRERDRGRSADAALADLRGAAAESTAATLPALRAVADALAAADCVPATLDDVRGASLEAAAALDTYLDDQGQRVVGTYDVTGRRLVELPEVILRSIAAAGDRPAVPSGPASSDERPSGPAAGDEVLADARLAVASRDDHSGIGGMWPLGLLRRALLVAGARLHEAGTIDEPDHVLECTAGEVGALLRGDVGQSGRDELASRAAARRRLAGLTPPPVLGDEHPRPDLAAFPAGLKRMAEAMFAFQATMDAGRHDGVGVGETRHRGRAVVAADPEDAIARLEPGDVLVTPLTTPAFNCVLPIAGALVTAHGGPMSHAGIAARELGIPAVLGVADALTRLPDGAEVEVDPVAGTVRVVATGS